MACSIEKALGITFAKTAERVSLHAEEATRPTPYARSMAAGVKARMGLVVNVAPLGSAVKASTAYLNVNGTCTVSFHREVTLGGLYPNPSNTASLKT